MSDLFEQADLAGLRVAVGQALADAGDAVRIGTRGGAESVFRRVGARSPTWRPMLPGSDIPLGTITVKKGGLKVNEAVLLGWVRVNDPGSVEEFIDPLDCARPEVLALLKEHFPEYVHQRVTKTTRDRLVKTAEDNAGKLITSEGEVTEIGEPLPVSGAFTYRPADDAVGRVMAAWRNGSLDGVGVDLGHLALPAPPKPVGRARRARGQAAA